MEKKANVPQKGAARKWSQRLKEMGQQKPPKDLIDKLNNPERPKKSASPKSVDKDLDI